MSEIWHIVLFLYRLNFEVVRLWIVRAEFSARLSRARDVPKIRSSVKLVMLSASSSSVEGCLYVVKVLKSVHLVPRHFLVARYFLGYL